MPLPPMTLFGQSTMPSFGQTAKEKTVNFEGFLAPTKNN